MFKRDDKPSAVPGWDKFDELREILLRLGSDDDDADSDSQAVPRRQAEEARQLDVSSTIPVDALPKIRRSPGADDSPSDETPPPAPEGGSEAVLRQVIAVLDETLQAADANGDMQVSGEIRALREAVDDRLSRLARRKRIDACLASTSDLLQQAAETSLIDKTNEIRARLAE